MAQTTDISGNWLGVRDGDDDLAPPMTIAAHFKTCAAVNENDLVWFDGRARVGEVAGKTEARTHDCDVTGHLKPAERAVLFTLNYDSLGHESEIYEGRLNKKGDEIAGTYTKGFDLTGEFTLRRDHRQVGGESLKRQEEFVWVDHGDQGAAPKPFWRQDPE